MVVSDGGLVPCQILDFQNFKTFPSNEVVGWTQRLVGISQERVRQVNFEGAGAGRCEQETYRKY
jgi:hypothetical protein